MRYSEPLGYPRGSEYLTPGLPEKQHGNLAMENLPQRLTDQPSALTSALTYLLVPIAVVALLPLLLLFIIVLHLLALVHGARIFVFSFSSKPQEPEAELQRAHFIEMRAPKALPDEAPKG